MTENLVHGHFSECQSKKTLTPDTISAYSTLKDLQYTVQGPISVRSKALELELGKGASKPFSEVIQADIGDSQAAGQPPNSYIRQVASVALNLDLMNSPDIPADAKEQAGRFLTSCMGRSLGSYTDSPGTPLLRQDIAKFLQIRDCGASADPENIVFTEGVSDAIIQILRFVNQMRDGKRTGVMVPVPQYPLYSAILSEDKMLQINYFLDEDHNWALNIDELRRAVNEAREHCNPSVIVAINPGNPTGQVLTEDNIREVIQFANEEGLLILADEVYQDNVYCGNKFHSFKKVLSGMPSPYNQTELISFYSVSKGLIGECGVRAGFMELINLDPVVWPMLRKALTVCHPNTVAQLIMDSIACPPQPGMPSYETYYSQREQILQSFNERAKFVSDAFNAVNGVHCNAVQGSMFAFPRVDLPAELIAKAKSLGLHPDYYYAQELLERAGICVVPGSNFGQRPDTYHFRASILPTHDVLKTMMDRFKDFHVKFMRSFS